MAYNLSAPPSYSLPYEAGLFWSSLSPLNLSHLRTLKNLSFPLKLHRFKPSFHIFAKVSLQEPPLNAVNQDSKIPDGKTISPSKSYVWVNPKSPQASKLRQKANDYWYASLLKIAESLNSCAPFEDAISGVLDILGENIVEKDAVIILNNMSNIETAPLVLNYFLKRSRMSREVVLYNLTLKVFRKSKNLVRADNLFDLMLEQGIKPDNFTFSTIISCARLVSWPEKAVEWYEKMPSFGCELDPVTCSVMVDVYGKVGNVEAALSLYDRARSKKGEMKALRVRPNASMYNSLLDAMGRANRPSYSRAPYGIDAIAVYREMKEKGFEFSVVLYNTLLSTCANTGYTDEATEIFQDMKSSENCKPDSWTYAFLIKISSRSGKVEEAETVLKEMVDAGFQPNIFVLTSLIQCCGKAGRMDDVVRTFDQVLESGMAADEPFCGSLLNLYAITQAPKEELGKLTTCIEKVNPKLGYVVKLIVEENIEGEIFIKEAGELLESIGANVKKAYCNCLIDICVNLNQLERACELLDLSLGLSLGAALTALRVWMNDLCNALGNEEFPELLGINTGHGKHKFAERGLVGNFESHLKELNAPFHEAPDKAGWFLTTKVAAISWLESRQSQEAALASSDV
ncbi:hypothetical protein C2S51_036855 [Perilla frutescens var. frutescens]|nr:hypothetical protein C2S51_036855 [Perilla frutescens var. frutescens]